jgi:hypothetical protein
MGFSQKNIRSRVKFYLVKSHSPTFRHGPGPFFIANLNRRTIILSELFETHYFFGPEIGDETHQIFLGSALNIRLGLSSGPKYHPKQYSFYRARSGSA